MTSEIWDDRLFYNRVELINGQEYPAKSNSTGQAKVAGNILYAFDSCPYTIFTAMTKVKFDENNVFYPDLFIICDEDKAGEDGVYGAPDLAVQMISPITAFRDRGIKNDTYEKFGVREYWIVDPVHKSVEIYGLANGRYELYSCPRLFSDSNLKMMSEEERANIIVSFSPIIFPEMVINTADIFRNLK